MTKSMFATITTLIGLSASSLAMASNEPAYRGTVGVDMWWASTKLDEVRLDDDSTAALYFAFENELPYLPNFKVRYTPVEADSVEFDKFDYTFYYSVLDHDLMHFDAGVTITDYSNTRFVRPVGEPVVEGKFDELVWGWHADASIEVPNSNFAVIGEFDFGNTGGMKHADVTAGMEYAMPFKGGDAVIRAGYRVIDLDMSEVGTIEGDAKVFVDGWFAGAEYQF